jgi:predicted RNase H-like HicB family nuclease
MQVTYEAIFTPEDGQYSIVFPDFEGATCGNDYKDAIEMAADWLYLTIGALLHDGLPLPIPTYENKVERDDKVVVVSIFFDPEKAADEWNWVSVKTAADMLGVTAQRVRVLARDGVLPSRKEGRDILVLHSAVEKRAANPRGPGRASASKRELATA